MTLQLSISIISNLARDTVSLTSREKLDPRKRLSRSLRLRLYASSKHFFRRAITKRGANMELSFPPGDCPGIFNGVPGCSVGEGSSRRHGPPDVDLPVFLAPLACSESYVDLATRALND